MTEGLSQIHLKDQIGKNLLSISVTWLLAGFAFLQALYEGFSSPLVVGQKSPQLLVT